MNSLESAGTQGLPAYECGPGHQIGELSGEMRFVRGEEESWSSDHSDRDSGELGLIGDSILSPSVVAMDRVDLRVRPVFSSWGSDWVGE